MTRTGPLGAALICGVIGLSVVGCTSTPTASGAGTGSTVPTTSSISKSVGASPAATSVPAYPLPTGTIQNNSSKAHQVVISTCAPLATGGHTARGTAHNVGAKTEKYTIVVYFTDKNTDKAVNWASTTLAVAPGKSAPWVAEKAFLGPTDLTCRLTSVS